MPTKLELMEAYFDVAEDKRSKKRINEAANDYQQALHFYIEHAKENKLSVDEKTGAYAKHDQSQDDDAVFEKAFALHFNLAHCLKELKQYGDALANAEAAYSYDDKSYKTNVLIIELKLNIPKFYKEAEKDIKTILNNPRLDHFQYIENSLKLAKAQLLLRDFKLALETIQETLERMNANQGWAGHDKSENLHYYIATYTLESEIYKASNRNESSASSLQKAEQYRKSLEQLQKEAEEHIDSESDAEAMDVSNGSSSSNPSRGMKR